VLVILFCLDLQSKTVVLSNHTQWLESELCERSPTCGRVMNHLATLSLALVCFIFMLGCSSGRPFSIDDDDDDDDDIDLTNTV